MYTGWIPTFRIFRKVGFEVMRVIIPFIALAFLSTVACAGDRWDATDKILLGTMMTTAAIDYGQTMHIARNPKDHYEYNPVLGDHPSRASVRNAFLVGAIVKVIIAELLPSKYRKIWLCGWTIGSGAMVLRNHGQGISFEW